MIFFNETAEEITGRKSYEVNLRPLATSIPSLAPIVEAAEALIAGPSRPRVEVRFERPDGRVCTSACRSPRCATRMGVAPGTS